MIIFLVHMINDNGHPSSSSSVDYSSVAVPRYRLTRLDILAAFFFTDMVNGAV